MSVSPETLALPEQQNPAVAIEVSRLQEAIHNTKRIAGRCALVLGLAAGPIVGEAIVSPTPAEATTFSNDYPDLDAQVYNLPTYDWWKDEDGNSVYSGSGELMSSRGYAYRNCTDGASYWTNKYTGVNVAGWGNAITWDNSASGNPNYTVYPGTTNSIEPGDIAQDEDPYPYGHVGFVTDVAKDSGGTVTSITVAELNKDAAGSYSHDTYTTKNGSGNFIRNGSGADWEHFIDVNGPGKGLNNEAIQATHKVPGDWNNDSITDIAVFRPSDGTWHIRNIGDFAYGQSGDIPVPGDYDGNGTIEAAVFRPSTGYWHVRGGSSIAYGQSGDIPVPADWNGDGTTDLAVYRPSDGGWHIRNIGDFSYGQSGDVPLVGDFDGNATVEAAVFRASTGYWYVRGGSSINYGQTNDIPMPADYNTNTSADIAIFRPSDGGWHVRNIADFTYGQSGDVPFVGDFDGNGVIEAAVFRPSTGYWHIRGGSSIPYGYSTDIPVISTLNAALLKQTGLVSGY